MSGSSPRGAWRGWVALAGLTALAPLMVVGWLIWSLAVADPAPADVTVTAAPAASADVGPVPHREPTGIQPQAGATADAGVPGLARPRSGATTRRGPSERARLPYGSLETDRRGWRQAGPNATPNPNATHGVAAQFDAVSCVAQSACPDGRPIAVNSAEKRTDFLHGLIDDRVSRVLLAIAADHRIVVNSARSSHPRLVQDRSGRHVDSNHAYGRAADITAVDGKRCERETAGRSYRTRWSNPLPRDAGPCAALAERVAGRPQWSRPTEVIFFWDVGGPAGVSLANHDDHVHVGFNAF